MVKINVNDKGECHVFVRGDWDKVRQHLLVAATKVRTMAADTRKFAKAASGKTPLADLKRKPEEPSGEAFPTRQPSIFPQANHYVPIQENNGELAVRQRGGAA